MGGVILTVICPSEFWQYMRSDYMVGVGMPTDMVTHCIAFSCQQTGIRHNVGMGQPTDVAARGLVAASLGQ